MTQEQKAKAYDEALERAKCMNKGTADYAVALKIFPELAESEDEKIRQLLIRFVKYDMSDNYSHDYSREDCLAWLEKQKEQKPVEWSEEDERILHWIIVDIENVTRNGFKSMTLADKEIAWLKSLRPQNTKE